MGKDDSGTPISVGSCSPTVIRERLVTYRIPSRVDVEAKVWEARKIARLDLRLFETDVLEGRVRALQPPQQVLDPDYRRPSHARRARVHHGVRGSEGANGGIRGGRVAARDDEEDLEEEQGPHAFA